MKSISYLMAILSFLFISCSKNVDENEIVPKEKLIQVKVQASVFKQSINPLSLMAASNSQGFSTSGNAEITDLELMVFDEYGRFVTSKRNITADSFYKPIFGSDSFNLTLPKGNYKIGLIGHNRQYGGLNFYIDQKDITAHNLTVDRSEHFPANVMRVFVRDSYIHQFQDFSLKSDTSLSPFKLTRLTSKLEINIEDKIVPDAAHILIGNMINATIYPFSTTKSSIKREGYFTFDVSKNAGAINTVLSTPIYSNINNPNSKETITVKIYNKDYVLLTYLTIPNVTLKPNHVTKLSGKFFSNYKTDGDLNLKTEILKDYSSTIIEQKF